MRRGKYKPDQVNIYNISTFIKGPVYTVGKSVAKDIFPMKITWSLSLTTDDEPLAEHNMISCTANIQNTEMAMSLYPTICQMIRGNNFLCNKSNSEFRFNIIHLSIKTPNEKINICEEDEISISNVFEYLGIMTYVKFDSKINDILFVDTRTGKIIKKTTYPLNKIDKVSLDLSSDKSVECLNFWSFQAEATQFDLLLPIPDYEVYYRISPKSFYAITRFIRHVTIRIDYGETVNGIDSIEVFELENIEDIIRMSILLPQIIDLRKNLANQGMVIKIMAYDYTPILIDDSEKEGRCLNLVTRIPDETSNVNIYSIISEMAIFLYNEQNPKCKKGENNHGRHHDEYY